MRSNILKSKIGLYEGYLQTDSFNLLKFSMQMDYPCCIWILSSLKNIRQSYSGGLWYEIFWDMFLVQKWIIWKTFLGFWEAILDPYFAFLTTSSPKVVIFIKNQRFYFFTVMNLGWLQLLGSAEILSFRRIWAHIIKWLLWKCVIWGLIWSFFT